ncbi:hypothetical protein BDW60DRAFT_182151 [Aspergillus nidulans var. acristatus]
MPDNIMYISDNMKRDIAPAIKKGILCISWQTCKVGGPAMASSGSASSLRLRRCYTTRQLFEPRVSGKLVAISAQLHFRIMFVGIDSTFFPPEMRSTPSVYHDSRHLPEEFALSP